MNYRILPDGTIEKEINVGIATYVIKKLDNKVSVNIVHKDHLGSSVVNTDEAGETISQQFYFPYGESRKGFGDKNTRQYTGQINDLETDLYYYNARYYNPTIGRFISVDPVAQNDLRIITDPQSLNYYNYTRNNPVMLVDPTGESWQEALEITDSIIWGTFDFLTTYIPIANDVRDIYEYTTVTDLGTGEALTEEERQLTGMLILYAGISAAEVRPITERLLKNEIQKIERNVISKSITKMWATHVRNTGSFLYH